MSPAFTLNKLTHEKDTLVKAYCFLVFNKNGEAQNHLADNFFYTENIGQDGFRYLSDEKFVLADWNKVQLRFSDDRSLEVLGRICYCEALVDDNRFSVIDGFYSPQKSNRKT